LLVVPQIKRHSFFHCGTAGFWSASTWVLPETEESFVIAILPQHGPHRRPVSEIYLIIPSYKWPIIRGFFTMPLPRNGLQLLLNYSTAGLPLSNERVRYDLNFCGTSTREGLRWQDPTALVQVNYTPILSSERATHIKKPQMSVNNFPWKRKESWSRIQNGGLILWQTGWLIVGLKLTFTYSIMIKYCRLKLKGLHHTCLCSNSKSWEKRRSE
jgi:hypothetical protein